MRAEKLLKKLTKLDNIYEQIDAEIWAYDTTVSCNILLNWKTRKKEIKLNLINQFREEIESMTAKKLVRMDYDEIDNWIETNS